MVAVETHAERGHNDAALEQHVGHTVLVPLRESHQRLHGTEALETAAADAYLGVAVEHGYLAFQPKRLCYVVAVHTRRVLSGDVTQSAVEVFGKSHILLVLHDTDARIVDPLYHTDGLVGRAVVDDQQLEIAIGLPQYAFDGFPDIGSHVVCRHQNCYLGHRYMFSSLPHRFAIVFGPLFNGGETEVRRR